MASARHKDHLNSYLRARKNESPSKDGVADRSLRKTASTASASSASSGVSETSPSKQDRTRVKSGTLTSSVKPSNHGKPSSVKVRRNVPITVAMPRRKTNMESLPSEMILRIFHYLGPSDLLQCASVCKRWLKLANDNALWKRLYQIYVVNTQKKKSGRHSLPNYGDGDIKQWKRDCIKKCVNIRNGRVQSLLKKIHPYTGLPAHTQQAVQKLGVSWQLAVTERSGKETFIPQSDIYFFPTSATVRWYSLQSMSRRNLKKLTVYGLAPVFFGSDGNAIKNSPCQRSLLLHIDLDRSKWSSRQSPDGQDSTVDIYILGHGLMLATWKEGGELAFVSFSLHGHQMIQRSTMGTTDNIYIPTLTKPPFDDVDAQYGLHGYSCTIELRNQRAVYWGQQFQQLHCDKQNLVGRYARLIPIRSDVTYDHSYTNKKIHLPWKTDVFKGIVQDMCILDVTVHDDQSTPMWCVSSPVKLNRSTDAQVNYHYEGDNYFIDYTDDMGQIHMQLIWVDEREQYAIVSVVLDVSLDGINAWYGTSY